MMKTPFVSVGMLALLVIIGSSCNQSNPAQVQLQEEPAKSATAVVPAKDPPVPSGSVAEHEAVASVVEPLPPAPPAPALEAASAPDSVPAPVEEISTAPKEASDPLPPGWQVKGDLVVRKLPERVKMGRQEHTAWHLSFPEADKATGKEPESLWMLKKGPFESGFKATAKMYLWTSKPGPIPGDLTLSIGRHGDTPKENTNQQIPTLSEEPEPVEVEIEFQEEHLTLRLAIVAFAAAQEIYFTEPTFSRKLEKGSLTLSLD